MLRRRLAKDDSDQSSPTDSAHDETKISTATLAVTEPEKQKSQSFVTKPRSKRRNGLIFVLGGIFGILVAAFFANQQDVISLDALMDLNLDALMDVIPQGIMKDVSEFSVCQPLVPYMHMVDLI
jgi:phospholipid:diacylglycerol acyltransferase